ncbi:hypothetical protein HFN20_09630 [Paenibacillus dendritiformis]|uniref:helix-turn-helix transcriptional regulator n=1 Tax=Paenibacillus dendritiformis TaxID=130049 RepID=UPI00143D66C5|nr:hypothetical protein [Paenibacillus dendritiformis]NKI21474.1 hypothetical protein [Paenibacillus dendritiformis]NRF97164.1 hypothetical protein [Paenibacillus dendritiformis]
MSEFKIVDWHSIQERKYYSTLVDYGEEKSIMTPPSNVTRYIKVPQEIRRCLFLDGNTVNVLLELVSWGMFDGQRQRNIEEWFAINQQLMALKTGLTENTVSSKIKELESKMFIEKRKRGRRNYYKLNTSLNPFVFLSEEIHDFLNYVYPKKNYETVMEKVTCLYNANDVDTFQEAVTIATIQAVKDSDFYAPYIRRILIDIRGNDFDSTKPDYLPNYHEIVYDLQQELMERIMRRFREELKKQG